jgi:Fur family ferric uptake transcriptional regulator
MKNPRSIFEEYIAAKNLKMTPQRKLILDAFLEAGDHFSVDEFYSRLKKLDKSIGQATVYRTMKLLEEAGLARRLDYDPRTARYEQSDLTSHHDHLVCDRCGKVVEFESPRIEELQEILAKEKGFQLTGHRMYLFGICPECRKAGSGD